MRAVLVSALIAACALVASAQTPPKASSAAADAVKKANAAFFAARAVNDAAAIANMLDDRWVMVRWDGSLANKREFLDEVKTGKTTYKIVAPLGESVRVHGNTAVVTVHQTFTHKMLDGKTVTDTNRSVLVWANENGQWKMVSVQGTLTKAR